MGRPRNPTNEGLPSLRLFGIVFYPVPAAPALLGVAFVALQSRRLLGVKVFELVAIDVVVVYQEPAAHD